MKLVVVMGTHRKRGAGAGYVAGMLEAVRGVPGVEVETLWLGDHDIRQCRGCMACYERGEEACPLRDGYLDAMRVLNGADAAVFYSPTYALSISGTMKAFFDRNSYVLHRPYFKGRRAIVLAAAAAWGQGPALATLRRIVSMMGFGITGAAAIFNIRYERSPRYRAHGKAKFYCRAVVSPVKAALARAIAYGLRKTGALSM
jgi:multimeric flavodoxin WrbA